MSFGHRVAAAGLAVAALGAVPAAAAPKAAPITGPAYVDLARVYAEYRKSGEFAKKVSSLQEQQHRFETELSTLGQLRYCSEAERKEALAIQAKPKPTEAEKTRLQELLRKSDMIDSEITTLS